MLPKNSNIHRMICKAASEGMPISDLEYAGLSVRIINALEEKMGIMSLRQLISYSEEDLLAIKTIANTSITQIKKAFRRFPEIESEKIKWNKSSDRLNYYKNHINQKTILAW